MTRPSLATDRYGLRVILLLYLVLSLTTLVTWTVQRNNTITGDEPWYLVQADGLITEGQFAFEAALAREVAQRRFYPGGLPALDPQDPGIAHSVRGPNGYYSYHTPGLSMVLTPSVALGKWLGRWLEGSAWAGQPKVQELSRMLPELVSRSWLLLLNGVGLILATWLLAGRAFPTHSRWRFASVVALALSMPLLSAASQIYPDLPSGVLCLLLLYWVLTAEVPRTRWVQMVYVTGLLLLPWLHIRFSLPAGLLALGWAWRCWAHRRPWWVCLLPGVLLGLSGLGLAGYNLYAYGHPVSGFGSGFMQYNWTALAVFLGLNLDQNQGLLMIQPLLWLGLLGMVALWREDRRGALVTIGVYAALIVPTAAHAAALYGGWSFSGRFGWAAGLVLIVPALAALRLLVQQAPRLTALVLACAIALQAVRYVGYTWTLDHGILFNRYSIDWNSLPGLDGYPIFLPWLASWLPFFLGPREFPWLWTFGYAPNLAFVGCVVLMLFAGRALVMASETGLRRVGVVTALCLGLIVLGGLLQQAPSGTGAPPTPGTRLHWMAGDLPGTTGAVNGAVRVGLPGRDEANHLVFGARRYLGLGHTYQITLAYRADASPDTVVAELELFSAPVPALLKAYPLAGTDGEWRELSVEFNAPQRPREVELRVFWQARAPLQVGELSVQALTDLP